MARSHLGIVGFADDAEVVPIVNGLQRDSLRRVTDPYVWAHGRRGYGTNMALGLSRAMDEIRRNGDPTRINRMILLTDGFASNPEHTLQIARQISSERVSIVSLGFGEFDMGFMDQIASFSGGAAEYIDPRHLNAAISNFLDQLSSIQNQLTDNTRISLRFRGSHRITDFYQTHPKVIYHGLARLGPDRTWSHRLADVERKAGLEMIFSLVHPQDAPGRKLVADVEVRYDVPANRFNEVLEERVFIEYGDDERAFMSVDPRVQRRYNDAFVEKQQLRRASSSRPGSRQRDARPRHDQEARLRAREAARRGHDQEAPRRGLDRQRAFRLKMGTQEGARRGGQA